MSQKTFRLVLQFIRVKIIILKKLMHLVAGELNLASGWNLIAKLFDLSIGFPKGNQAGTVMAMASMSDSEKYVEPLVELMTNVNFSKSVFSTWYRKYKAF